MLHQVGPIGKHLGAQGTTAPALLLAVQALVLHVRHTVSESLGAKFTAKEGSSALLCCRRVCRRSAAEEANTVEHSGQLAGWYRARTGMEGLEFEAWVDEDSILVSGKEVLFIVFFFFSSGVFRSKLKS